MSSACGWSQEMIHVRWKVIQVKKVSTEFTRKQKGRRRETSLSVYLFELGKERHRVKPLHYVFAQTLVVDRESRSKTRPVNDPHCARVFHRNYRHVSKRAVQQTQLPEEVARLVFPHLAVEVGAQRKYDSLHSLQSGTSTVKVTLYPTAALLPTTAQRNSS